MQHDRSLSLSEIRKSIQGTAILNGVSLTFSPGSTVALLGSAGSGKSTLVKILDGLLYADLGQIIIDDHPYQPVAGGAHDSPIAVVHQGGALLPWMSITENVAISCDVPKVGGIVDWRAINRLTEQALADLNCHLPPGSMVSDLSRFERCLVEVAVALLKRASYLVLDDLEQHLSEQDQVNLLPILSDIAARGIGLLIVTESPDFAHRCAQKIVIIHDGQVVTSGHRSDFEPAQLPELMAQSRQSMQIPSLFSPEREEIGNPTANSSNRLVNN